MVLALSVRQLVAFACRVYLAERSSPITGFRSNGTVQSEFRDPDDSLLSLAIEQITGIKCKTSVELRAGKEFIKVDSDLVEVVFLVVTPKSQEDVRQKYNTNDTKPKHPPYDNVLTVLAESFTNDGIVERLVAQMNSTPRVASKKGE
jgi:hypothetical protein